MDSRLSSEWTSFSDPYQSSDFANDGLAKCAPTHSAASPNRNLCVFGPAPDADNTHAVVAAGIFVVATQLPIPYGLVVLE